MSEAIEDGFVSPERHKSLWQKAVDQGVATGIHQFFQKDNLVLCVPRVCIPPGAALVECYQTEKEWVIIGQPPDEGEDYDEETGHNCDAMGCGSLSHVLARIDRQTARVSMEILAPTPCMESLAVAALMERVRLQSSGIPLDLYEQMGSAIFELRARHGEAKGS